MIIINNNTINFDTCEKRHRFIYFVLTANCVRKIKKFQRNFILIAISLMRFVVSAKKLQL
jgi:hypothetical protein